jgi:hypothetical protein
VLLRARGKGQDCALNHLPANQSHLIQVGQRHVAHRWSRRQVALPHLSAKQHPDTHSKSPFCPTQRSSPRGVLGIYHILWRHVSLPFSVLTLGSSISRNTNSASALDSSAFVPQIKPEPVACRRVFPNIPIPDLSEFHALLVEVPEADGKTYAIAVHPRNHPDPGINGKDAVKGVDRSLVS